MKRKRIPYKSFIIIVIILAVTDFLTDIFNIHIPFFDNKIKIVEILSIHDGDTIKVINEYGKTVKIRLFGIDAPELKQEFGKSSQKCLQRLLSNNNVTYTTDNNFFSQGRDKYGRVLATIYNGSININHEMIKQGCAWNYFKYSYSLYGQYLQYNAKYEKKGLWKYKNPQEPWNYRKYKKK